MPKDMAGVMGEFKRGELHSGASTGPVVRSRQQAIAIGLSEQQKMRARAGDQADAVDGSTRPKSGNKKGKG